MRAWYANHPDRAWSGMLIQRYGITAEDYYTLLAQQGGGCAICGATIGEVKRNRRLFVDHDHKTKRVRGLLCAKCNTALGYLKDRPKLAHRLVAYLSEWL